MRPRNDPARRIRRIRIVEHRVYDFGERLNYLKVDVDALTKNPALTDTEIVALQTLLSLLKTPTKICYDVRMMIRERLRASEGS